MSKSTPRENCNDIVERVLKNEKVSSAGFQNYESHLDLDHLKLVLKTSAQLHGGSVVYEEIKSKELRRKFKLDEEYDLPKSNISLVNHLGDDVTNQVSKLFEDLERNKLYSQFRRTLCHGNLNSKNVTFRYKNGTPVDCRLTNFEFLHYGVPICDVLQVIFFNSGEYFQQQHFRLLLEHYYKCLETELGLNCEEFLPHEHLRIQTHHFLPLIKLETFHLHKGNIEEPPEVFLNSPLLSKEDCYIILENKIGTTNYEFLSFEVTPLSNVSGFLGQYYRLKIQVIPDEEKTINFFVKCNPKSGIHHEIARDLESFSREVFIYEIIVPKMKEIGINMIEECLSPCYFHRHEDLLVFEDMSLIGFQNLDAMKPLNFDLLTLATRKLARFHACSLIFEEKLSCRLTDHYQKYFKEPLFFIDEKHLGSKSYITGLKSIPIAVNLLSEIRTEANEENFWKCWPKLQELFYTVVKTSDRFRNVLSHGDLWTSNLLVKFQDDKPVDCVFIDFQIARYCPPAYDLLSLLHLTTHRHIRQKHEEQLLRIYYDELDQILQFYGYSLKNIYPYEDLIASINYIRPQMLLLTAIECCLTMCTPEEVSSFVGNEEGFQHVFFDDRTEFIPAMCQKSEVYKTRLEECILDIYDYCNSLSSGK